MVPKTRRLLYHNLKHRTNNHRPSPTQRGGSGVDSTGEKDDHIQDNEKVNALSNGKDLGVTVNPKGVKRGRTDSPPKLAKSSSSQNPEEQEENNADPPIDLPAEESSA